MEFERNYKIVNNRFWDFFFPTVFSVLASNMAIFVDSIIVSTLIGAVALSGMQIITPMNCFINIFCWMIGLGGSLICGTAKSNFDEKRANNFFTVSIISIVIISLIMVVIGLLFPHNIIQLLSSSNHPNSYALEYFKMYIFGIPFLCYMISMSYFVRTDGLTKFSFKALLISSIMNPVFDIVFINYFHLGMAGSGLATTLAYICGSIYMSQYFFKSDKTLKFIHVKFISFLKSFVNICKSGFAGASNQLYLTITMVVYNYFIISLLGNAGLVAQQICTNTLILISIFLIGLIQTTSPIISTYYEDGDYSAVDNIKNISFKLITVIGLLFTGVLTLAPGSLIMLYSVNNDFTHVVINALQIYGIRYLTIGFLSFYVFYIQSIQMNKWANIVSLFYNLILAILILVILVHLIGVNGIWISYVCVDIVSLVLLFIYSRYLNKKSYGEYHGFFINKSHGSNFWEFTINANYDDASKLSSLVKNNLKNNPLSDYTSKSLQDFLFNVIETNNNLETIDVLLDISRNSIKILIKDLGIERDENFNFKEEPNRKIEYSRVLGLNSTLITIN